MTTPATPDQKAPTSTEGVSQESQVEDTTTSDDEGGEEETGLDFFAGSDELDGDVGESVQGAEQPTPAGGDEGAPPATSSDASKETPATPVAEAAKPEAVQPGQTPPVPGQVPAPAEAKPGDGQAAAGQQTQDQQTPTPSAGNEPQGDFLGQVRGEIDKNRETYTNLLAEKVYAMSEEESKELFEDPGKVLPKLASKVHLEVVQNVLGTLGQVLPSLVHGLQQVQVKNQEYLNDFWNSHPTLDRNTDRDMVLQLSQMYRAQHPNASFEEFKRVVGAQAMVALNKLPVAGGAPQPKKPAAAAKTPAFRPAGNSAPMAPTPPPTGEDYWGAFAQELDEV